MEQQELVAHNMKVQKVNYESNLKEKKLKLKKEKGEPKVRRKISIPHRYYIQDGKNTDKNNTST